MLAKRHHHEIGLLWSAKERLANFKFLILSAFETRPDPMWRCCDKSNEEIAMRDLRQECNSSIKCTTVANSYGSV